MNSPGSPRNAPGRGGWGALGRWARLARGPVERFLRVEASSGIVLVVAAGLALAWANWPGGGGDGYQTFWRSPPLANSFNVSLNFIVNDILMVVFFFVVGMEIRREIHAGELSDGRRAALPAIAALGGMLVPALVYLTLAGGPVTRPGWGVPMATDIAFAVGVLALLGKRVPPGLRVLLLALAVIDDLGAIVVIAIFYSSGIRPLGLAVAAGGVAAIVALRAIGVRHKAAYLLPGAVVWAGTYASGIHPTIGGVVIGLLTPVRPPSSGGRSPADGLIDALHPWVAFAVMPLFALANAGVTLGGQSFDPQATRAGLAVAVALLVGKPVGVLLFCELALRMGVARLPAGLGRRELLVLGLVAGIGFTMSLFVAELAFTDGALLASAKLGILGGSAVAALGALAVGRALLPQGR